MEGRDDLLWAFFLHMHGWLNWTRQRLEHWAENDHQLDSNHSPLDIWEV